MISTTIFIISLIVGWRLKSEKFFCAHCRRKRWIIDSEASFAAEMTSFTRCMFCVVAAPAGNSRLLCLRRCNISAKALSRAWAPLRPKLRRGPLQGAVRLVTRKQKRQQQKTFIKSSALSESMCTESSTECSPRLLGPLLSPQKDKDCGFSSGSCQVWGRSSWWCLEGLLPEWRWGGVHRGCLGASG